jgi:hypothetical protein
MRGVVAWTCGGLGIGWSALMLTVVATGTASPRLVDVAVCSLSLISAVIVGLVLWRHRTVGTSRTAAWAVVAMLLLLGYPLGVLYLIFVAPSVLLLAIATAVMPAAAAPRRARG